MGVIEVEPEEKSGNEDEQIAVVVEVEPEEKRETRSRGADSRDRKGGRWGRRDSDGRAEFGVRELNTPIEYGGREVGARRNQYRITLHWARQRKKINTDNEDRLALSSKTTQVCETEEFGSIRLHLQR